MHQLAVVGGVRNVNGVPGVFGPADGRGQCCMVSLLHLCEFIGLKKLTRCKKAVQCYGMAP